MILDGKKNKERREKKENECHCAAHARMLAHYDNGLYKYVCQKCALEFFSRERLQEQEGEMDAALQEDTWWQDGPSSF